MENKRGEERKEGEEGEEGEVRRVREWFVRLENIHTDTAYRGYQHIEVMYTSEKNESTMGPLIDTIMTHYALPDRIRPYLRIWSTPFRTNRLMEGDVIPPEIEFLYVFV